MERWWRVIREAAVEKLVESYWRIDKVQLLILLRISVVHQKC